MSPDPERFSKEPAWIAWEHIKLREIYDLFRPGGSNSDGRAGPVHFYSGNASVRREHLLAVGGFDENYRRQEDVELAVRLARDCGVWFLFDFATDATHRPTRTFESWIRIPRAYGQLDAQRVKARTLDWAEVEELAARRNPATRLLANTCAACPFIEPAIIGTLRVAASTSWRLAARGPAVAALSAIYNSVYRGALIREMRRLDMEQGTASAAAIGLGKPNI